MKDSSEPLTVGLMVENLYKHDITKYERAIEIVEKELRNFFEDIYADYIHYIKSRIKSKDNLLEKIAKKGYNSKNFLDKIDDIAGVRVVCHNESDVEKVITFIKGHFPIVKDEKIDNREDCYKARHIVIEIAVVVAGYSELAKVEIQIRTLAQDLFATLSHRDMYKLPAKLPESWTHKMKTLGEKLQEVDKIAQELKNDWIEENLGKKIKNQISVETITRLVKSSLGKEINIGEGFLCLSRLIRAGVTRISELEEILKDITIAERMEEIYNKLLDRSLDPVGLVIYGSWLFKYGMDIIPYIEGSIKISPEYQKKYKT